MRLQNRDVFISTVSSAMLLLVLSSSSAIAAPREGGSSADAGMRRLLQELNQERDTLLSERNDLTQQLEAADQEQAKLSAKLASRNNSLKSFKASNTKFAERLQACSGDRVSLKGDLQQQGFENKKIENQRLALVDNITQLNSQLNHQLENNRRLVAISNELVSRYKGKGVFAVLKNQEPLTQLSKVAMENLVQEYQFEIEDLTVVGNQ
ncbi:MAG: hypothetical protein KBT88_12985 [Gammaproteobacteria bacterium]|nr:hypothetical protein [Gammaproteobacteria bacterium]MBQ0840692.1 hypothetical protein [Gammaproteobacteria bacterium]